MNIPMSWIKKYVNIECSTKDFAYAMTMSGSNVECIENRGNEITGVVVGKVTEIEKHPDADKLLIVKADIGKDEILQIVTGAKNLFVGAYVPVALDGATLADGLKIKKSKLRGVTSNGMFCSVEELGFTISDFPEAPEDGIYIFEKEYQLGACVKEILQIDEDVLEFEITSNRADCFSIIGLAREAAATLKKPFELPKIEFDGKDDIKISDLIDVEVKNNEICKRYTCRVIKNVQIKPSPQWLRHYLTFSGIRPINNIVDITNYVMLEIGQPMHSYDMDKINGNKIIVRNANIGEKLVTLDGLEREFDKSTLVIQDSEKLIDLAGIMGGENSMITESTKNILLESANFDGYHIRLTGKKLGIRTDASAKYEKGLDPNLCIIALDRACQLIEMLGCGEVVKEHFDFYPNPLTNWEIPYSSEKINKLLGTDISKDKISAILKTLDIDTNGEIAKIPTFRTDLQEEADLAEEVARIYGYDKIKPTLSSGTPTVGKKTYKQIVIDKIIDILISMGLSEALHYSFEGEKVFNKLEVEKESDLRRFITISNPLGEDFSIMRTNTLNTMLNSLSLNYNRRNKEAFLFEIGKIYLPKELPLKELPIEKELITIGMYGNIDFYNIKGVFESIFNELGIFDLEYSPFEDFSYMHPGRTAKITNSNGEMLGYLGEIHPKITNNYEIETKVYFGVLEVEKLLAITNFEKIYKPLPKFPSIQRDISMLIKEDVNVREIEKVIKEKGGKLLEKVELFDIYQGEQIEKGNKSVSYSIIFRADEKTLTDEEVNAPMKKILKYLEEILDAKLRDR